jgi:arylformamidase
LGAVLNKAEIPGRLFGARDTTHNMLNENMGLPDDPATIELSGSLSH